MTKRCFVILWLSLFSLPLVAQHHNDGNDDAGQFDRWKEIESQKIAFFTHELEITTEEATLFWPIYNEMTAAFFEIERERRDARHALMEKGRNVTEKECLDCINKIFELDRKRGEIKERYYRSLLEVMPASKVCRLDEMEERFRQKLFEHLRRENPLPEHRD